VLNRQGNSFSTDNNDIANGFGRVDEICPLKKARTYDGETR
jgi:hypothetical protein